jgi:hypothetical protein
MSDALPVHNGLTQGYALSPLFFNFALEMLSGKTKKIWKLC